MLMHAICMKFYEFSKYFRYIKHEHSCMCITAAGNFLAKKVY